MKTLALILGMHRSGTSLLSRSLKVFGAEHGENLLGSRSGNTKGHWEDLDTLALNTEMLESIGKDWKTISPLTPKEITKLDANGYSEKIKNLIIKKTKDIDFFVLKEPRITHLLPIWKSALSQLPIEKKYFFALRNPLDVAQSLYLRDNMEWEHGYLLWFSYVYFALQLLNKEDILCVCYDDMVDNPTSTLESIKDFLGRGILKKEKEDFLKNFIDRNLRHSHQHPSNLESQPFYNGCDELFKRLKEKSGILHHVVIKDDPLLISFLYKIGERNTAQLNTINELENQNRSLHDTLIAIYNSRSWKFVQLLREIKMLVSKQHNSDHVPTKTQ